MPRSKLEKKTSSLEEHCVCVYDYIHLNSNDTCTRNEYKIIPVESTLDKSSTLRRKTKIMFDLSLFINMLRDICVQL